MIRSYFAATISAVTGPGGWPCMLVTAKSLPHVISKPCIRSRLSGPSATLSPTMFKIGSLESAMRRTSIPCALILYQAAPPEKCGNADCQQPYHRCEIGNPQVRVCLTEFLHFDERHAEL